ncbi:hypothetical protein [Streptomyces longhuiensis]|uniref:hypothetical protein n=1 Tax=Streptomyces longhuiensis TaxID=2880933 RepID=UPI001D09E970|nr:hypothetical protein [Streptomyces longhuiensis]UDM05524.1 hypothetical protein LGI35_45590 [Streptomyces longhuiensis]
MRPNRLGRRDDYRTPRSYRAATGIGATTRHALRCGGPARLPACRRAHHCVGAGSLRAEGEW